MLCAEQIFLKLHWKGMVEKWNPVLGPEDPRDLREPQYFKIPWSSGTSRTSGPSNPLKMGPSSGTLGTPENSMTPGTPRTSATPGPPAPQDLMDPQDHQDLWTLGPPGTSGPQDPWEITFTVWNSESKHPETLKLQHKQRTFLNYIIGQSQIKAENCVYLLRLFYLSSC